jgi:hypothetical protein
MNTPGIISVGGSFRAVKQLRQSEPFSAIRLSIGSVPSGLPVPLRCQNPPSSKSIHKLKCMNGFYINEASTPNTRLTIRTGMLYNAKLLNLVPALDHGTHRYR